MCILIACKPGAVPETKDLERACVENPDGFGWATVTDDGIRRMRTLRDDSAIGSFLSARRTYGQHAALFHARIATHGEITKKNCHPFFAAPGTVVAHNGIMPQAVTRHTSARWSDTRVFAESVLPHWTLSVSGGATYHGVDALADPKCRDGWARWMGRYNRVAILSRRLPSELYILNESTGHWRDGVWYSNDSYRPWQPPWQPPAWDKRAMVCDVCDLATVDRATMVCIECGCCAVCGRHYCTCNDEETEHRRWWDDALLT